jgi:UDPglucose 6-dehydrogenase
MSERIALVGNGYLGQAYERVFPEALVYDEPKELYAGETSLEAGRLAVNACDMAIVAVPTDPTETGELNMSIVEDVVGWLETPDILIKSALQPGTADKLVEETGKNIAVSVEYLGMGNYYMPEKYPDSKDPTKHRLLVIGGETAVAGRCASRLWNRMSPDIRIHLVTAREAEIVKLVENFYGALKVTFANCLYNLVENSGQSFIKVHQAWGEDGRTDPMHTRVTEGKRGWQSHCYSKDIQALGAEARNVGATDMQRLASLIIELNNEHLKENG